MLSTGTSFSLPDSVPRFGCSLLFAQVVMGLGTGLETPDPGLTDPLLDTGNSGVFVGRSSKRIIGESSTLELVVVPIMPVGFKSVF